MLTSWRRALGLTKIPGSIFRRKLSSLMPAVPIEYGLETRVREFSRCYVDHDSLQGQPQQRTALKHLKATCIPHRAHVCFGRTNMHVYKLATWSMDYNAEPRASSNTICKRYLRRPHRVLSVCVIFTPWWARSFPLAPNMDSESTRLCCPVWMLFFQILERYVHIIPRAVCSRAGQCIAFATDCKLSCLLLPYAHVLVSGSTTDHCACVSRYVSTRVSDEGFPCLMLKRPIRWRGIVLFSGIEVTRKVACPIRLWCPPYGAATLAPDSCRERLSRSTTEPLVCSLATI